MKKVALITGASRGIGKEIAIELARCGYKVYINCISSVAKLKAVREEIIKNGDEAICVPGDVGKSDKVREIFSLIKKNDDRLDILVNNAAISYLGVFDMMSDGEWQNIIDTNLSSVFYCSREAAKLMIPYKNGKILNISSIWGTYGASCEVAYASTKSGVNGFTKSLAKELAPSNISVNAISFGMVATNMNSKLSKEDIENFKQEIPIGRIATPNEAGKFVSYIAKAPTYMTGQIIGFDGGF